ncbi:MAG: chemotaxis protein CheW [Ignavibacteriales bacterium]
MKFTFEPDDIDILQGIVEESTEHLNGIEEGILKLEVDFDSELVDSIFRALHSVKGVSSFVDFVPMKNTAHSLESMLTDMRKGLYTSNSDTTDVLLRGVDILHLLVAQMGANLLALEDDLPKSSFAMEFDDYGFEVFIEEVEALREKMVSAEEPAGQQDYESQSQELPPQEITSTPKVEISLLYQQILDDFLEEVAEHLDTIEQNCVQMEKHPHDPELLNTILRGFHSIKGGAGVISSMQDHDEQLDPVMVIKRITHAAESLLQTCRNESRTPTHEMIDLILATVDRLAVLSKLVRDGQKVDFTVDDLIAKMESLSTASHDIGEGRASLSKPGKDKLSQQVAAFMNISGQALESMSAIINSAQVGKPVNKKRLNQYKRALKSLISTAQYMGFSDFVAMVQQEIDRTEQGVPEEQAVSQAMIDLMSSTYQKTVDLLNTKLSTINESLNSVPVEYADKKLGEILVAEQKVSLETLDEALHKQKKIGEILVESGAVNAGDVEIALAKQQIAKEKVMDNTDAARTPTEVGNQSIRVSQEKLDRLMNMIGELLISKNRIFHLASKIGLEYDLPALSREVKGMAGELDRISNELQNAIMSARMVPLRILFQRYPRTIRDLSRKVGKNVDLLIEGEETELDKTIIEAINDPLVHMLRNSVDHGLEMPEVRQGLGKDPKGIINLRAYNQGSYVVIEISDDGKGLNPDEIKLKALKKGLINSEQIESMSSDEALRLIFAPGFSTKEEVTELSGRGVGMDVVRSNVESIGGSVALSSVVGQGSTFVLKIPLSMSIIKGLMVETCGLRFIIGLDSIEETVKILSDNVRRYKNSLVADIRGEILPLIYLKEVMGIGPATKQQSEDDGYIDERLSIVVINVDGIQFGLIVDRFQNEQEFVIKSLGSELAALKIYTGATILGDGSVVLILNPAQLLHLHLAGGLEVN